MAEKKRKEWKDDGAEADIEGKDDNKRKEEKRRRKAKQMDQILSSLASLTRTMNQIVETQKLLILNQEILQVRAKNSTIGHDDQIQTSVVQSPLKRFSLCQYKFSSWQEMKQVLGLNQMPHPHYLF